MEVRRSGLVMVAGLSVQIICSFWDIPEFGDMVYFSDVVFRNRLWKGQEKNYKLIYE